MNSRSQATHKPSVSDIRTKGQVWTPRWVADAMATYLKSALPGTVLDPAVGPGVLLAAVRDASTQRCRTQGFEIDEDVLSDRHSLLGFARTDIDELNLGSFLEAPTVSNADAVIANPPYLRHHSIPPALKKKCKEFADRELGVKIDARAGLHVYFLIKALSHLNVNGRLAFIVPADTFEGVFAENLWNGIAAKYSVDAILTFSKVAAAFPGVDTNATIVFISRREPTPNLLWMQWNGVPDQSLSRRLRQVFDDLDLTQTPDLQIEQVRLADAIKRGLSRDQTVSEVDGVPFVQIASVVRGIATGDNSFFLMTRNQIQERDLSEDFFVRTVARVRDVPSEVLTLDDLEALDLSGRPTFLLSISKTTEITEPLKRYLAIGESTGISGRALVQARSSWYLMERRAPVPILFCYLGRRNQRFILTKCDVQPTTGFLCVYPAQAIHPAKLQMALNHPSTIRELSRVGKSYGDGALKVEPGGLRKLIVPHEALATAGL
jgi:adenine-specific DNA-methyltransferase